MFAVVSPAIRQDRPIQLRYATRRAGGENLSPPMEWSPPPPGTRSLALVVVDRHPAANDWIHWLVTGLSPETSSLPEGAAGRLPSGHEHRNTFGNVAYDGPQPPPGTGAHEYEAIVFALDVDDLRLPERPSLDDVETAVEGHVLASGSVTGHLGA